MEHIMNYQFISKRHVLMTSYAGKSYDWVSTDSEEAYQQNCDLVDPIYKTKKITYEFNTEGYRTPELDTFTDNNFILVIGCSYTAGIGLAYEDMWSSVLSKRLNIPVMNLGMPGMGLDAVLLNLQNYLRGNYPKPKFIVVQHSEITRSMAAFSTTHNDVTSLIIKVNPIESESGLKHAEELLSQGNHTNELRCAYLTDAITVTANIHDIPVLHWTHSGDGDNYMSEYKIHSISNDNPNLWAPEPAPSDVARDNAHDGILRNRYVVDFIVPHINQMLRKGELNQPAPVARFTYELENSQELSEEELAKQQLLNSRKRSKIIYN